MKERFEGAQGRRRLVDALLIQKCVRGQPEMANDLATAVAIREMKVGEILIQQDGEDTHMYFILAGKVDIIVNDRVLAQRHAGEAACVLRRR